MAVKPIRIWPDPVLCRRTREVSHVDDSTAALVSDLFDTMYAESGIGLAANQIGTTLRVAVIDLDPQRKAPHDPEVRAELQAWGFTAPLAFINPKIVAASGYIIWEEGCLSVPGVLDNVKRRRRVRVRALDLQGKPFTMELEGLFAVALQHELDHLDGKVFIEYLPRLKQQSIRRRMQRQRSAGGKAGGRAGGNAEAATLPVVEGSDPPLTSVI